MSESKLRHLVSVRSDERVNISYNVCAVQCTGGGSNASRVYD